MSDARTRLASLLHDADEAAAGGHASVPARLLQHRELLAALRDQIASDIEVATAVQELLALVRVYPVYSLDYRNGSEPERFRWGLRPGKVDAFDRVIEKLTQLVPRERAHFPSKEPTP